MRSHRNLSRRQRTRTQRFPGAAAVLLGAIALGACVGTIGGSGSAGGGGGSGAGGGDGGSRADAGSLSVVTPGMRRLTANELNNTVQDLLTFALGSTDAGAAGLTDLLPVLAQYPVDTPVLPLQDPDNLRGAGFTRLDTNVTTGHIQALLAIGAAFGAELTNSTARITSVFGSCATDADPSNDASCIASFINKLGPQILRRPVTSDDVAFYSSVYSEAAANASIEAGFAATYGASPAEAGPNGLVSPRTLAAIVTLMMNSPDFVYHVEDGDPSDTAIIAPLNAYEVASRLSYNFWETMPDAELQAKAADGSLLQSSVLTAEVTRLINDPRAQGPMAEFFSQWLRVNVLPALNSAVGSATFTNFAAGFTPTVATAQNAIDDVTQAGQWVTLHGGTLNDLLTSTQSFATTSDIATLYGVSPWDGTSTPPTVSDPTRAGLITRIAFLASGTIATNPILKGVSIREGLLCYPLPAPPANAANTPLPQVPTDTTRQETELLTASPKCNYCHAPFINPLGFATENFDSLGRSRTAEDLFDNFGNIVGQKPVDTESVPQVSVGNMEVSMGAADVTKQMIASGLVTTCFAQNYFEFALGRLYISPLTAGAYGLAVSPPADQAAVAAIATAANQGTLLEAIASVVSQPEFLEKSFQ